MRPALLLFCAMAGGCTDAGQAVFIYHNQGCGSGSVERGLIDTQESPKYLPANGGYIFVPLVVNNAEQNPDNPGSRLAKIRGADITLEVPVGFFGEGVPPSAEFIADASFTELFSGVVDPGGGSTAFSINILPRNFMQKYLEERIGFEQVPVQATITIFGEMGSSSFEAPPYPYTIDVCGGCMIEDLGPCSELPEDFVAAPGGNCNAVQDVFVQCCIDETGDRVCPAVPPMT